MAYKAPTEVYHTTWNIPALKEAVENNGGLERYIELSKQNLEQTLRDFSMSENEREEAVELMGMGH